MKKTEKIVVAIISILAGVLLAVLRTKFLGVLTAVAGVVFILFSVVDLARKNIPVFVIKAIGGVLLIVCACTVIRALIYVIASLLIVLGSLSIYDKIKNGTHCETLFLRVCEIVAACICFLIGILLMFHTEKSLNVILIFCGGLTTLFGSLVLLNALAEEL